MTQYLLPTRQQGSSRLLPSRIQAVVDQALNEHRLVGAVVLVAQGRLHLDEGIERWLPAFRPRLADGSPARIAASPESTDTWRWGGAYGHSWFVDPAQGLSVAAFTNTLYEGMSGRFVNELRDAVYGVSELGQ